MVRFEPFQRTTDPFTKLDPFTVRSKAGPPAEAEDGLRLVIVGMGLLIVKGETPERPPPGEGLNTATLAVPAAAMSAASIVAVISVALT